MRKLTPIFVLVLAACGSSSKNVSDDSQAGDLSRSEASVSDLSRRDAPADGGVNDVGRDHAVSGDAAMETAPADASTDVRWASQPSRVLFVDDEAWIEIDGQRHRPIFLGLNSINMSAQMWLDFEYQIALAKQAGSPVVLVAMGWNSVADSAGRKALFDRLQQLDVKVIVRFSLNALTTKMMAYQTAQSPMEDRLYQNVAGATARMIQHRQCDPADTSCTNPNTIYRPAVDQAWVDNIWVEIRALLEELDRDYPGRVIGLQLAHLNGGEWFLRWDDHVYPLPGSPEDPYFCCYEPAVSAAFCSYLAQQAPGLACAVPSAADRHQGSYGALLLDDSSDASRRAVLFNRFVSLRVVHAIKELAARAKALSGGRLLVSTFYGYLFEHNRGYSHLTASGHLAYAELLADSNIDAVTGPYSYGPTRYLGTAFEPHGPVDTPRLHGKLWIHEDDSRTHFATADTHVTTLDGSKALLLRNGLTSLLHQNGLYTFDLWTEGWFGQDRDAQTRADSTTLWQALGSIGDRMALLNTQGPRAVSPQIAIFVDDLSAARHPIATVAHRPYLESIYRDPVLHGSRLMAPVRYYLLSDLARPDFPASEIRLAIFANAFDISPAIRQAIASKLQRDNKVLFYLHAAGAMRGGGTASHTNISELVGFDVARGTGARATTSTFVDSDWTWLPSTSFGLDTPIDPWFHVPAGQGGVIAVARDSAQQITVARKAFATHRVLYAVTPGAPRDLYRTAAAWANVHQYTNNADDVVEARGNLLMLHAGSAGRRQLSLPAATPRLLVEIEANTPLATPRVLCTSCSQTEIDVPAQGATYLLRWE